MKLSNWKQLKARTDLVVSTQTQQGQLVYVIKDPITLRYFRLRPTEYAIMKMLDGETPVDEVKRRLSLLGHDISDGELEAFLRQLGAANFYENVLPNQSESLYQLALLRRKHKSLWAQIKRILFIKVPLYDPDRLFARVMPWIRFLWSKPALYTYGTLFALAVWAFLTSFAEARAKFSAGLLTPQNLLMFWVIFILVKTLHELGHGFTCKYYGGEVHELGILILVLTPCLYCNITDAWIQEKHSRKFYISSAGIIVELIIASIAALVWWATGEGTANRLAYRVMILAGISSVIFNGNPLMKFDGYYILSDILGIPNLRSSSVHYVREFFRKYVLGLDVPGASVFSRENAIKLAYGLASSVWIFYVMFRIVRSLLHRIPPLGVWILATTVYGLVMVPIVRIAAWLSRRRGRAGEVNVTRLAVLAGILGAAAYFLFFHDVTYAVSAHCVVQPSRRQILYARTPGVLIETPFREGQLAEEGGVVARLRNRELELALEEMVLLGKSYDMRMDHADSSGDLLLRELLRESRADLDSNIEQTRERIEDLMLRAPFAGTVLTPSTLTQVGRFIPKGEGVIELADLSSAKVTVAVTEKDLNFVRVGADASVTLRAYPWETFSGTVASIAPAPLRYLPELALSAKAGGGVVTRTDTRMEVAVATTYEVSILLPNDDLQHPLKAGMAGKAKISYGKQRRLWNIIYMRARQTVRRSFGV